MSKKYTVGDYLLDRLTEFGVDTVFGVPGDYNLEFLDHIVDHPSIKWVGNANELNAGYSADGYGRIKGLGALVTTFGVGELSALNAVSGSYAEHVPVIHIVGAPAKEAQTSGLKMHHTLGDGDFEHFFRISREITCAYTNLEHFNATSEIDRVLKAVITHKKPGYILLSTDVARVETFKPQNKLIDKDLSLTSNGAINALKNALDDFFTEKPRTGAILADLLTHRMNAQDKLQKLCKKTDFPFSTLLWGKSLVDESSKNFAGIYMGAASEPQAKDVIENSTSLISLGVEFTDLTSCGFTQNIDTENLINITPFYTQVKGQYFTPIEMRDAIDLVIKAIAKHNVQPYKHISNNIVEIEKISEKDYLKPLEQENLWRTLIEYLEPGNTVICDQGTSFFGMAVYPLPKGTTFIGQPLWGSIGYALPATLGVKLANPKSRPVLVTGDGAIQLTIQEIGILIREKVNPVIIVVNNNGYTVERAIHGPNQPYNDITNWDWTKIPFVFGGNEKNALSISAKNVSELRQACELANKNKNKLVLIEVHTDPFDYPPLMVEVAKVARNNNLK